VVARALHSHHHHNGGVYLSLQHLAPEPLYERFGRLAETLRSDYSGLDLARDRLPVAPAAHYCMGGIRTDTWGRTDVPGLYAAGEVACSGVHGANRLASNSLLECLVFGARAAEAALADQPGKAAAWHTGSLPGSEHPTVGLQSLRSPFPEHVLEAAALGARLDADLGVERGARALSRLVGELPAPEEALTSDLLLASLVARAALLRRESRGTHYRTDAPELDPDWRGRIHWRRGYPPAFERIQDSVPPG
ncbi:MAG: FAD-binding protein, partial [Chloroflexota bacterium]|nr:FAD-binding protein [Chloroflexota bacterium]